MTSRFRLPLLGAALSLSIGLIAALLSPASPPVAPHARGDAHLAALARPYLEGSPARQVAILSFDATTSSSRMALFNTTASTYFRIGSLTKPLTVALYDESVRRGEVTPNQKLREFFPELSARPAGEVTLNELAHHAGGFGLWGGTDQSTAVRHNSTADLLRYAADDPLRTRGEYQYSNIGTALLGMAVAQAADADYHQLLEQRVLEPLNMRRTGFPTPQVANPPIGLNAYGLPTPGWQLGAFDPGGGAVSTLMDMGLFTRTVLRTPTPQWESHSVGGAPVIRGFARTTQDGRDLWFKTGSVPGFESAIVLDPAAGRAIVVLSDSSTPMLPVAKALLIRELAAPTPPNTGTQP